MKPVLEHYLVVGALLFALGLFTVLSRRGAVGLLLGVALLLNAASLDFVAFERFVASSREPAGQIFVLSVIVLAAAATAIVLALASRLPSPSPRGTAGETSELGD